tara:strand:+ start:101 stop:502 length:402 start_codon:yes stop_codon:yes gene_type:complete
LKNRSAGVVVLRKFQDEDHYRVLCLEKENGKFDITKGIIDPGETDIETAIREVYEESGISDLKFSWGLGNIVYKRGISFVAETESEPFIPKNPITGVKEHVDYMWMTFDEARRSVEEFLVPAIEWAESVSGDH